MGDTSGEGGIDEGLALGFFGGGVCLHAEDAPDGTCGREDGGGVGEIAFDYGDVWFRGEGFGACGGCGAGDGDDVEGRSGLGGEQSLEDTATLFCGSGYVNSFWRLHRGGWFIGL